MIDNQLSYRSFRKRLAPVGPNAENGIFSRDMEYTATVRKMIYKN